MLRRIIDRSDTKEQRKRNENENVEAEQGCNTKEQRERGMRMLRRIRWTRNENVEAEQGCNTKEQRERGMRNEGCDTKGQRERERGMRLLRWIKDVTLRDREREREE